MKKIILSIVFLLVVNLCFSQAVDTTAVLFNAKLNTVNLSNAFFDEESIESLPFVLNDTSIFKTEILKSVGFRDVIFIRVDFPDGKFSEIVKSPSYRLQNRSYEIDEFHFATFVLAYSLRKNRFYKLKGFVNNEYDIFFYDYSFTSDRFEKGALRNRRNYLQNYKIEGVDLNCLHKSLRAKKGLSFRDYPCLEPNHTRMIIINGIPYYY